MKTTKYFEFRRKFPDRLEIKEAWIKEVLSSPVKIEKQIDGRIRMWGKIEEAGGRYLQVIVLEDGETIHNAFFDRKFKG